MIDDAGCDRGCDSAPHRVPILTRPAGQSAGVRDALSGEGIASLDFPLIDIQPTTEHTALDAMLEAIESFALVFFVSPNAIEQVFTRAKVLGMDLAASLARDHAQTIVAVVGPGSARALATYGITPMSHRIVAPAGAMDELDHQVNTDAIRYDSEALWQALRAEVDSTWFPGRPALIFRGDGGREWFADALRSAGMVVTTIAAYRRGPPLADNETWQQIEQLIDTRSAVWVLSSSEGVRNLETLALARYVDNYRATQKAPDPRYTALKQCAVIVPHHRIAEAASRAGFDTIVTCGGGDANLLRAIREVLNESERIANENGKPYA